MQKFFRGTCFPGNPLLPTAFLIERQAPLFSPMPSVRLPSSVPSLQRSPNPSQTTSIRRAFFGRANSKPHHGSAWLSCGGGKRRISSVQASKKDEKCEENAEEVDGDELEKNSKVTKSLERRNRGESSVNGESIELLAIPGIGPRNLRKLADKGFQGVTQLKQLYKDKFFGKSSEKMVEFLQSSVGIIHKNHAESITTFIKESVDEEIKDDSVESGPKLTKKNRLTFCVEGNISVGKSTFLQRIANETLELRDLVEIVPEPVSKWQDVGRDHFNILGAFYAEPERYAYTFQNYVFVTRVMQERESAGGIKPLRLMERSVFSDRMVFVRAVHEANWMNEMEISIYDSWFDPVVSSLPGLTPDGFIYLRATPDTCHRRMLHRKRNEEGGVTLDYLRGLHEKHESWLFPSQCGSGEILSVSGLPGHLEGSLPPNISKSVFYLEGNHMHSSIQKVPALILDCDSDIDFNRDIDAKQKYAQQVAEFFEFVKRKKEISAAQSISTDPKEKTEQQIMLPHSPSLWVPNGFTSSKLEFRRSMSSLRS